LINKYHALASTTEKSIFWLSNVSILTYNSSTLRILNPAWSLDIELQFYFLFPILAYLATRWKNSLGLLIIVFFALSTITWTYYLQNGINSTVISYLYLFLVGMAVYYKNLQFSPRVQITGFILLLAILGLQVFLIAGSENHPSYTSRYAFKLLTLAGVI
jgi:peptidoglycan/LPS O-acetylase OafA/YrhL